MGCARFVAAPTNLDLLGFPRFTCPRCGTGNKLPLTSGRRLAYRIIVGVIGVGTVIAWINGIVAVPGLLAIAVVYALVKDASLRSEVEARELGHASEPKRKRRAKP